MSALAVAKKDFKDGIRSWSLLGLTSLFALFLGGVVLYLTAINPVGDGPGAPKMIRVIQGLSLPSTYFIPIVGTMVGYKAIVGERSSGSLKFLLGLPHSRRDIVVGKLLGRTGIITVAVLIGFAVGGVVLYAFTTAFNTGLFLIYTAVTILLGVTFVSIAVAFSSTTASSRLAIGGAITLVLWFLIGWKVFMEVVKYAAIELSLMVSTGQTPDWIIFLNRLNPTTTYSYGTRVLYSRARAAQYIQTHPEKAAALNGPAQSGPFYLDAWFGLVILAVWLVVPIGLAYIRFKRADL